MAEYALRLENATDTAARVRAGHALGLFPAGVLNARSGLRNDGGGAVTVVAGTMDVSVAPFAAWVDGGSSDAQAGYPFVLDAAKVLTLDPGDGAQVRVDTIAVVINDTAFDGSGSTSATVTVVKGTPGAGAPGLPATALPLRDISVPVGASLGSGGLTSGALSTDRRTWLAGGILRVASQTERDALSVSEGAAVYRADTDAVELYTGSAWRTMVDTTKLPKHGSQANVTTNSGGTVNLNHNLGSVPVVVHVYADSSLYYVVPFTGSATSTIAPLTVRRVSDGSLVVSTNIGTVYYTVWPA